MFTDIGNCGVEQAGCLGGGDEILGCCCINHGGELGGEVFFVASVFDKSFECLVFILLYTIGLVFAVADDADFVQLVHDGIDGDAIDELQLPEFRGGDFFAGGEDGFQVLRRDQHLTSEGVAEVLTFPDGKIWRETVVEQEVAEFMERSETSALYMLLLAIEHHDEVIVVDDSAHAFESLGRFGADDLDAVGFENILDVSDGIEAELPVFADFDGQIAHLLSRREWFAIERLYLGFFFTKDFFDFEVALYFVLDAHLEGVDIFDGGVGLLAEGYLKLVEVEREGSEEVVDVDIQSQGQCT